jgi:hypothetical protein
VHKVYLKAEEEMHHAAVAVADDVCGFPSTEQGAAQDRYVEAVITVHALGDLWERVRASEVAS